MKVLITAGGTSEPIDAVRSIKNDATGKLGSLIAEEISKGFPDNKIFYVHSPKAYMPQCGNVKRYEVQTVYELEMQMQSILMEHQIDVVIHSMAVSDYKTKVAFGNEVLEELFTTWNQKHEQQMQYTDFMALLNETEYKTNAKLTSANENLFITLVKTPKIIEKIKRWSPKSQLIGFKLLNDVTHEQLIDVAYNQLIKNDELYVVANDNRDIHDKKHIAYIVDNKKNEIMCQTKEEIAQLLVQKLKVAEELK